MKYKVHIGYLTTNNEVIKPGIYDASQIDLAEARMKSIVTFADIPDSVESVDLPDISIKKTVLGNPPEELAINTLEPTIEIKKVKALKINLATPEELENLKYVGKKTVQTIIEAREKEPFKNYIDLDKKVPLKGNRKWQDIAVLDFEAGTQTVTHKGLELK